MSDGVTRSDDVNDEPFEEPTVAPAEAPVVPEEVPEPSVPQSEETGATVAPGGAD